MRSATCLGVLRRAWSGFQKISLRKGQQPPLGSIKFHLQTLTLISKNFWTCSWHDGRHHPVLKGLLIPQSIGWVWGTKCRRKQVSWLIASFSGRRKWRKRGREDAMLGRGAVIRASTSRNCRQQPELVRRAPNCASGKKHTFLSWDRIFLCGIFLWFLTLSCEQIQDVLRGYLL